MKISEKTIKVLAKVVTGDSEISPYKKGAQLVEFFNNLGFNDTYGQGFPSRWYYTEERIKQLNGKSKLNEVFKNILDPREFLNTKFNIKTVVEELNNYLEFDSYKIIKSGISYKVVTLSNNDRPVKNSDRSITNQGKGKGAKHKWENLYFRSKTEIKIAEALDETGVLFLPNCKVRLNTSEGRKNLETDFLVCYEGKWGILEVDGKPYHPPENRCQEQERERYFRHYSILIYERFDAKKCYNNPDGVVREFLELLKKA